MIRICPICNINFYLTHYRTNHSTDHSFDIHFRRIYVTLNKIPLEVFILRSECKIYVSDNTYLMDVESPNLEDISNDEFKILVDKLKTYMLL